jgi:hypothetical protein
LELSADAACSGTGLAILPRGLVSLDPGIQVKLWNFLLMQLVLALGWQYNLESWSVSLDPGNHVSTGRLKTSVDTACCLLPSTELASTLGAGQSGSRHTGRHTENREVWM